MCFARRISLCLSRRVDRARRFTYSSRKIRWPFSFRLAVNPKSQNFGGDQNLCATNSRFARRTIRRARFINAVLRDGIFVAQDLLMPFCATNYFLRRANSIKSAETTRALLLPHFSGFSSFPQPSLSAVTSATSGATVASLPPCHLATLPP